MGKWKCGMLEEHCCSIVRATPESGSTKKDEERHFKDIHM
jgi:hypothetical protein